MIKAAVFEAAKNDNTNTSKNCYKHIKSCGITPVFATLSKSYEHLSDCNYLIVCGSSDIHPRFYNQNPLENKTVYDIAIDECELNLIKAFISKGKPVLGICRGMQSINVALGGSLIQDIPSQLELCHLSAENTACMHEIKISKNSLLHKSMGLRAVVNSFHHQCIHIPACDVFVAAASHDGIIEAIEGINLPILGVQWNPEKMIGNTVFEHFFNTYK